MIKRCVSLEFHAFPEVENELTLAVIVGVPGKGCQENKNLYCVRAQVPRTRSNLSLSDLLRYSGDERSLYTFGSISPSTATASTPASDTRRNLI